jgi:predicted nucleic acid-binding protein
MSPINLGEVAYQIERRQGATELPNMHSYLQATPVQFMEASRTRILSAAHLKAHHPISYADAFAAALCEELDATLLTGDPEFRALEHQIKIEWLPRK